MGGEIHMVFVLPADCHSTEPPPPPYGGGRGGLGGWVGCLVLRQPQGDPPPPRSGWDTADTRTRRFRDTGRMRIVSGAPHATSTWPQPLRQPRSPGAVMGLGRSGSTGESRALLKFAVAFFRNWCLHMLWSAEGFVRAASSVSAAHRAMGLGGRGGGGYAFDGGWGAKGEGQQQHQHQQ